MPCHGEASRVIFSDNSSTANLFGSVPSRCFSNLNLKTLNVPIVITVFCPDKFWGLSPRAHLITLGPFRLALFHPFSRYIYFLMDGWKISKWLKSCLSPSQAAVDVSQAEQSPSAGKPVCSLGDWVTSLCLHFLSELRGSTLPFHFLLGISVI